MGANFRNCHNGRSQRHKLTKIYLFQFKSADKAVKCSICDGFHYRTNRNFASNLKIIIQVNKAVSDLMMDMKKGMGKIDRNLIRVKRNLEYMEKMYDSVFRKVNRLVP